MRAYRQCTSFELFGWMHFDNVNLTAPGLPQYLNAVRVTPELANGIGVNPRLGRWFRDAVTRSEVVLSNSFWLRLGGDASIVGKTVTLDRRIYQVAGVMPARFQLPLAGIYGDAMTDVWLPLDPSGAGEQAGFSGNFAYARLRSGVTLEQARQEASRIAAAIVRSAPESHPDYTVRVDLLHELVTREVRPVLLLLFAAAELLLLITCANAGGLLLARSVSRARETAVRVALGASLRQLAYRYFWEGLVVAVPGAVAGLVLATALVRSTVAWASRSTTQLENVAVDWRVAVFAIGSAVLASALTSVAPLWQAKRTSPNEVLSEGVRASAGARSRWLSKTFVVAEIALAFVLLGAGAALATELYYVTRVSPGFEPAHLLTFRLVFSKEDLPAKATRAVYIDRLVGALEAVPGVSDATLVNQLPLDGCCFSTAIYPEDKTARRGRGEQVSFVIVSPGYWKTLRIPLIAGRLLDDHDHSETPPLPVVIDQAAARYYWPGLNPVGVFGRLGNPKGDRFQVVGIVGDVRNNGLDTPTIPEIYLSAAVVPSNGLHFVVRSGLPAGQLVPEIRRAIQSVNPSQPIHNIRAMTTIVEESVTLKRVAAYVMTFFAAAALLMAMIGTYGMVSYSTRQRTVEMGTRLAIGAVSRDLLGLVLGSGMRMAAYGVALGGAASVGVMWLLVDALSLRHASVLPFAGSAISVGLVVMAASFFPAWRATLLSPMAAIRDDPGSMWEDAREGLGRFFEGIRGGEHSVQGEDTALTIGLIESSRGATTFREAIGSALEALRFRMGARSAALLERGSDGVYRSTFAIPAGPAGQWSIPAEGLLLGRLRSYGAPLPISAEDFEVWRRWAAEYRPQSLPEIEMLDGAGTRIAAPLRTAHEVAGVLLLGAPDGRDSFTPAEKGMLRSASDQFALLIENARLTDRVLEQEKLRRDVALAADVQRGLLPPHGLETGSASTTGVNVSARTIGGDYFDFFEPGDGRTAIALADVSGKGVPAALIMSVVQASLRVISADPEISLPEIAARMNHFVYRSTGPSSYATFFYAELCGETRRLRYVNAAQSPVYVVRKSGGVESLPSGGTVIGMFPQWEWTEAFVDLSAGDVLLVATDGVTDALSPAEEDYGEERLMALLPRISHLPVEEMSAELLAELRRWIEDAPQADDLTFVLMKVA
jgi:predicted permease